MNDQDDTLNPPLPAERAASKLHDPTPERKKYVVDLLYRFLTDQISYSQLMGISQKELYRISEIGHLKLQHGRLEEAHKIFDCLVKMDHLNPFYHCCLGGIFQKRGKYVKAVFEYSEALKLKKDDLPSLVNRGEIYLKHKNFKRAAEDFRSAILLDPSGKDRFANRARSLVIAIKRSLQLQKEKPKAVTRRPAPANRFRGTTRFPTGGGGRNK